MDSAPRHFDPPEAVVSPAFAELLARLQRARLSARPDPNLPLEERILFDYGVAQRRRVLEHTLFLVFGQWLLYRQFITRFPSRTIRTLYGATAFFSTVAFMRRRASAVTQDLFAHVVTRDDSSALANEARIVLAELEGPDGPYFTSVCRARGFTPSTSTSVFDDTTSDIGDSDTVSTPLSDGTDGKSHPQLHLTPRLLTADVLSSPSHPNILPPHIRIRSQSTPSTAEKSSQSNSQPQLPRIRRHGLADIADLHATPETSNTTRRSTDAQPQWRTSSHSATSLPATRIPQVDSDHPRNSADNRDAVTSLGSTSSTENTQQPQDDITWGKPFDFSASASVQNSAMDFSMNDNNDPTGVNNADSHNDDEMKGLTPSQRRAAERKQRRLQAQARTRAAGGGDGTVGSSGDSHGWSEDVRGEGGRRSF